MSLRPRPRLTEGSTTANIVWNQWMAVCPPVTSPRNARRSRPMPLNGARIAITGAPSVPGDRRPGANRFLPERVVGEDEGGHRLDHGNGAGEHARIVAATRLQHRVLVVNIHGVLR